jgi:RNA-directed DNA polymerase
MSLFRKIAQLLGAAPSAGPPETHRHRSRASTTDTPPLGIIRDLDFSGGDASKRAELGLPALVSFAEIASQLGTPPETLAWVCFRTPIPETDHYHHVTIPKRSGGTRAISVPKEQLSRMQRSILREILARVPAHPAATAFTPGASIVDHARRHSGKSIVVRLDIEDFFPSITYRRVKGMFQSLGYSDGTATILGLLTTDRPRGEKATAQGRVPVFIGPANLPQGASTSPAISNLICRRLDARLSGLARAHGFTYSRYADDLTFSHADGDAALGRLLTSVPVILREEGFRLNDAKTRIMRAGQRQVVTGLAVNDGVAIPRAELRRFRAFIHACERDGLDATSRALGKDALAYARGYTAFIAMVEPNRAASLREKHPWLTGAAPEAGIVER